jgi:hypothetical protein
LHAGAPHREVWRGEAIPQRIEADAMFPFWIDLSATSLLQWCTVAVALVTWLVAMLSTPARGA